MNHIIKYAKKKIAVVLLMSIAFGSAGMSNPRSAQAVILGAVPVGVGLGAIGGIVCGAGAGGLVAGLIVSSIGVCCGAGGVVAEDASEVCCGACTMIPGLILVGLGGTALLAGIILEQEVVMPPLVRLTESESFARDLGVDVSAISEFNDSLEQVAELDSSVLPGRHRLIQSINKASQASDSIELSSLPEAANYANVLGFKNTSELLSYSDSVDLVSQFSDFHRISKGAAQVYLKTRLGFQNK